MGNSEFAIEIVDHSPTWRCPEIGVPPMETITRLRLAQAKWSGYNFVEESAMAQIIEFLYIYIYKCSILVVFIMCYMGVSINGESPKWMVYKGKSHEKLLYLYNLKYNL